MFPTRSDTKRVVQTQKMVRALKFRIQEVEGLYYPYSENKGADLLCGYLSASLFSHMPKSVFSQRGSHVINGIGQFALPGTD